MGFKIDAYYMLAVHVTSGSVPTVDLLVNRVGIDSDRIDADMREIESQEGFKKWVPGPRDVLRQQLQRTRNALQGELHGVHYHEILALWQAAEVVRNHDRAVETLNGVAALVRDDFTAREITTEERAASLARIHTTRDEAIKRLVDEVAALRSRTVDVMLDLYGVDALYRPQAVPEAPKPAFHGDGVCHYCENVPECRSPWGHWLLAKLDLSSWGL